MKTIARERRQDQLGFTRAPLVYKPWNENRKVVRQGANLLSFRCRRCRNRKTHRQPVFFSLFARPPFSPEDLGGPTDPVVCSLYVRQCRGTAAERGRAPRNDLRLNRGRFGPPIRCRWVSREASSSSPLTCCRRYEGSWGAYLRMQERIRKPRQMSTPRSCLRGRILWFFGSVPTFYSQISQKRISQ